VPLHDVKIGVWRAMSAARITGPFPANYFNVAIKNLMLTAVRNAMTGGGRGTCNVLE